MDINFKTREIVGKKLKDSRKAGLVPCVCYGKGFDSKNYFVSDKELDKVLKSDEVLVNGKGDLTKSVTIQEVDYHYLNGEPIHCDFLIVDTKSEIEHEVPIKVIGESPAVKNLGGLLVVTKYEVIVKGLPQNIPGHIDLDISDMEELHSHKKVSDLKIPNNIKLVTPESEMLVSIVEKQEEVVDEEVFDPEKVEVQGKGGKKENEPEEE